MLPTRRVPGVELETQLIGAVLNLQPKLATLAALGLTGDEFSVEGFGRIWKHVVSEASAGRAFSWETVAAKATATRQFPADFGQQLERIAESSTLTADLFRVVAAEFKNLVTGQRVAGQLEQLAARIRQQGFDPAREAGTCSGIERECRIRGVQLKDLTHAQQRILDRWDSNIASNKSDLIATGIGALDKVIGGLPKVLCIFAAAPGVGKTGFMNSMFHSMLLHHPELRIGLVGLEDGDEHVPERWLARGTGFLLREIGSKKLVVDANRDEGALLAQAAAANYPLLERMLSYVERGIDDDELISVIWQMAARGCGVIGIDNFNKIRIKGGTYEQPYERLQRFSERLSETAEKAKVVLCLIVHEAAPMPGQKHKLQGGQGLERDARFVMHLSPKGDELRGTITKANKLCKPGTVIAFERQATAGLINPDEGHEVNVEQERRVEKEHAEDAAQDRQIAKTEKLKAKLAKRKAELEAAKPKPEAPAQTTLALPEVPSASAQ